MGTDESIKIVIIDDNQESVEAICNYLKQMPEVELIQCQVKTPEIKKAILKYNPDILLIEAGKLNVADNCTAEELSELRSKKFRVIFFPNNTFLNLLQNRTLKSEADILNSTDLKNAIGDYIKNKSLQTGPLNNRLNKNEEEISTEFIAFQTVIGLRFINKRNVVYFEYSKDEKSERRLWEAHLDNEEVIRLKMNTTSKEIMKHFETFDFIQISQSNIINMNFFSSIESKSRKCILHPPFENKEMIISRAYLNEIKNRFEID
jgi:chemotaxis response regulator CheB